MKDKISCENILIKMPDIYQEYLERQKNSLTFKIRGAIFEVHKQLGVGLFEECYHQALLHELRLRRLKAESKVRVPVIYKGIEVKEAYELDILVEDKVIIELKSVETLSRMHFKQLQNYMHLMDLYVGFLVNFNAEILNRESLIKIYNKSASDTSEL